MHVSAIIVAGGKGIRMRAPVRKQYLMLDGRPILSHTVNRFTTCGYCDHVILVIPPEDSVYCRSEVLSRVEHAEMVTVVSGGAERQDSVYSGLNAVPSTDGIVLIHDGVRPFVTRNQIQDLIACAAEKGACMLGIAAFDTLKEADARGCIQRTLDRNNVYLAQTPQAFQYHLIKKAHEIARERNFTGTDDASLVEQSGHDVFILPGNRDNIKITAPEDLKIAEAIIKMVFDF